MSILKDIPELIQAEVITADTAAKIQQYYKNKEGSESNRLFVVFGVLGAILVGLGIILIVAHNWDELSRRTKTILSFLPLIIGQILCAYALMKKQDSTAWREAASVFLFLAIGACISLVGQVYNLPGDMSGFLLTWMLLALPLVYVMRSSVCSLLYLIGITAYGCNAGYWSYQYSQSFYWLLYLLILPHYYLLYKNKPSSNAMFFHNWMIPLSLIIVFGSFADDHKELMFLAYFSLFGVLYLIGELDFFKQQKLRNTGYKVLGTIGTVGILLALSFDSFWKELLQKEYQISTLISLQEFLISVFVSLLALGLLILDIRDKSLKELKPITPMFLLFFMTFILGLFAPFSVILINLFVFAIGILTIRDGAKQNHLGVLNFGLLLIAALVTCRFFDDKISFIIRGLLFVSVGVGFFATNYWMLKKRKENG